MGALMLGSGTADSFRVPQAMSQAAPALGIDHLQAQVRLTTSLGPRPSRGFRALTVQVPMRGGNADRIAALEMTSRILPGGHLRPGA